MHTIYLVSDNSENMMLQAFAPNEKMANDIAQMIIDKERSPNRAIRVDVFNSQGDKVSLFR